MIFSTYKDQLRSHCPPIAACSCKPLKRSDSFGGESGIRTLPPPLDSVSYRFHIARVATNASDAVAPCPPLPARSVQAVSTRWIFSSSCWILGSDRIGLWTSDGMTCSVDPD
jgi:hypothetical protein